MDKFNRFESLIDGLAESESPLNELRNLLVQMKNVRIEDFVRRSEYIGDRAKGENFACLDLGSIRIQWGSKKTDRKTDRKKGAWTEVLFDKHFRDDFVHVFMTIN